MKTVTVGGILNIRIYLEIMGGMFFMRQLNKKAWSLILTLCIAISMVIVPAATVNAAADETGSTAAADYGLVEKAQDGAILHAFNWSYNAVKSNL